MTRDKKFINITSSFTTFSLLCCFVRYEGDWVDGRRQGKGQYVCKQSGSKYEVKAKYSCDIKTFHGANDFQPNRANTAMIRRRDRASTAGAMVTGMRESGRRDSDMATGSMYGRIKMKSMTHDTWSLSGDNPFTLLRYLSFVESIYHCYLSNTKTAQRKHDIQHCTQKMHL